MYALCTPQSGICTQALHFIAPAETLGFAQLFIYWKKNKMKRFFLIFALCMFGAAAAEAKLMTLSHFKLDNGLETVVIENHKAPVVLQMLYYKTGSVNDPKGKGGIAHLLEHMMFRGTKKVPDKMFNRLTDEHGAENNAYTTYQETGYYEFSDIAKLELMMALEADRMRGLDINDEAFATERDIVLQERMQRYENSPVPLFYETADKILWQGHPLANPVSGSPAEIMGLTSADAKAFYDRWYRPDNALLVISGDITAKEAEVLVRKYYGRLKAGGAEHSEPPAAGRPAQSTFTMKLKGVEQPRFVSAFRMERGTFDKREILALELLADYLAGDDTAYLYDELVYGSKALLSLGADVSYDEKLGGALTFYAVPAAESIRAEEIAELVRNTANEGVGQLTEEKLEKVKNRMLSSAVYMQENPESAARFAGGMLLAGYTPEEIMTYDDMIKSISVGEARAAWDKARAAETVLDAYLTGDSK